MIKALTAHEGFQIRIICSASLQKEIGSKRMIVLVKREADGVWWKLCWSSPALERFLSFFN